MVLALFVVSVCGCSEKKTLPVLDDALIEQLADLPGLNQSDHPPLKEELVRLTQERMTPRLLKRDAIPPDDNVAVALAELFPKRRLEELVTKTDELMPPSGFTVGSVLRTRMDQFAKPLESRRLKARRALQRPSCDFGLDPTKALFPELSFLQVVTLASRLEAFHAAGRLALGKPDEALGAVQAMLDLAELLSREQQISSRLMAAIRREEALRVLEAVVAHPKTDAAIAERLYGMLRDQLRSWPSDADCLIGDRAEGLLAYEMVRCGHFLALLTQEEFERFAAEKVIRNIAPTALRGADKDQAFYLDQMRKIIAACRPAEGRAESMPFYQRKGVFEQMRVEADEKRKLGEFPIVAGRMLLPEIETTLLRIAEDRARTEMWALALAAAAGLSSPQYKSHPATGAAYRMSHEADRVIVYGATASSSGLEKPIVVRRFDIKVGRRRTGP